MAFKTENKQLNILMGRARAKNNATNALKQQDINVDTLDEIESKEESQESDFLDIGGVSLASGIGVEPIGVSRSIEKAQEDINVASSMAGVGDPRDAGQIAFGMAKAAGEKSYVQDKPFEAAVAGFYDSALAQSAVNLAPAVAAYAGNIDLARGLGTVSGALTGPIPTLLTSALMGPSMKDPYNQTVAMGSGMLNKVSSAVMSTHFDVADKMARGVAGYNQGYYRGNLVSIEPGIFGVGKVMTGVTVPTGSISDFEEAIKQAELQEDEDAASGYMQGNPAAMMQAGIDVSDFGSSTEAAQAGIGYSSYSPDGNPTGAAPSGSQYSYTGTFSTDDNNDSDDNNDTSNDDTTSTAEDFNDGGKVGMALGDVAQKPTTDMGFIGGPPDQFTPQQTIADDIPKEVPEGTFVINAPAVEFAGKEDIKQMLVEAYEIMSQADTDAGTDRTAQATKIPSKEQVDIMISRGEVVVPPEIAKVIGYDRLEKINNRGKKEVSRRQEESQQEEKPQAKQVAEGGFIGMQEGDVVSKAIEEKTGKEYATIPGAYGRGLTTAEGLLLQLTGTKADIEDSMVVSKALSKKHKNIDSVDNYEDVLRHILLSGYASDSKDTYNPFIKMGKKYLTNYMDDRELFLAQDYDPSNLIASDGREPFTKASPKVQKESMIDLQNNKFGRVLREQYPNREEFQNEAFKYVENMLLNKDKELPAIKNLKPKLSIAHNED
tara:strand:+ start:2146 stop:4293 length:2148 start_codon:yes stop_codon:yes gene_type:complete